MSLGGDDFLTKPIEPSHLIRSVAIRAERARTLRSFMLTDNLTGLLNHTRIKEQFWTTKWRAPNAAEARCRSPCWISTVRVRSDTTATTWATG